MKKRSGSKFKSQVALEAIRGNRTGRSVRLLRVLFYSMFDVGRSMFDVQFFKYFFKYCPVYEALTLATCSGVPLAIIRPPASPPSGPRSII